MTLRVAARRATGLAAGLAAAAHALPALTALPLLRVPFPGLRGAGAPGHIALTFDDGPDPAGTPQFLDLLAAEDVRATFFVLGTMLQRSPELGARAAAAGHELGVHGWDHRCLLRVDPATTGRDLQVTRDLVTAVTGVTPTRFRPPYGVLSTAALLGARRVGLQPVLWSAWGRDWSPAATASSVVDTVTSGLRGGGTVLLHDSDCTSSPGSWRVTLDALPILIRRWRREGWSIGPLREHARAPVGGLAR